MTKASKDTFHLLLLKQLMENTDIHILALSLIKGIGPIRLNKIIESGIDIEKFTDFSSKDLKQQIPILTYEQIDYIKSPQYLENAHQEQVKADKNGIEIITKNSPNYPKRFLLMDDKPLVLYSKGKSFSNAKKVISIIGTRGATNYGKNFLNLFFESLSDLKDVIVVSGLAYGIDEYAHKLSIKHNIPTIAMMGLYLDKIYPAKNTTLANDILKSGGGWMTETSSIDATSQGVFPKRNRLIAGMSDATFVVESDIEGGSIITAKLAFDYGKDVFALAGRYNEKTSRGCNKLIQQHIAQIVYAPEDIVKIMNWDSDTLKTIPKNIEIDFEGSVREKKILDIIRNFPAITHEELKQKSEINHSELVANILQLELDGWIQTLPGNKYDVI